MNYRASLDGIRAIAVLAVVLFHAGIPGFGGGFVGVDVFFVISGYLITGLLLEQLQATGDISVRGFIERRIRRLAPAMFVVLGATLAMSLAWLSPIGGEQQGVARSAIAAVLLSANHYFLASSGGYFDAPREHFPLLHTWSLSVEEQFYLAWPWLLLLAWRFGGKTRNVRLLLMGVFIVSLAACAWWTQSHQQSAFFLTPFRAWEFAAGGCSWILVREKSGKWGGGPIAAIGLAAVVGAIVFMRESAFPGWIACVPVLGTACLIFGVEVAPSAFIARCLATRPMVQIGLLSYSFYLWHWPLLSIATIARDEALPRSVSMGLILVALALSYLTWRFVEEPVRRRRSPLMATRARAFGVGGAMAASLLAAAFGLGYWAKFLWTGDKAHADVQQALISLRTPSLPHCSQSRPYSGELVDPAPCTLPQGGGSPTLLFWGDSHAFHLQPVAESFARQRGVVARIRYMPACPPLLGVDQEDLIGEAALGCADFNEDVLREVRQLRSQGLTAVVIAARWPRYFQSSKTRQAASLGLQRSLDELEKAGVRVVVMGPLPSLPHRAPACLLRRDWSECGISRASADEFVATSLSELRRTVSTKPHARLFEPLSLICSPSRCDPVRGQAVLFYDENHLSADGSRLLLPGLSPVLDWSLAGSGRSQVRASK